MVSSGLLKVTSYKDCISDRLELLDGLDEILFQKNLGPNDILDNFFTKSKQAELSLVDFPHMKPDVEILRPFLKGAIKKKEKGVNILIYGIPGAGKTELVRSLAESLEMDLFEINVENSDEAPLSGQARFCAYQLCQKLLSKKPSLILFDEIEDIFPDQVFSLLLAKRETNKGWTNRALETNPNPAFWLCNSIDQIDKSYLRRFDYAFEMRIPPASVREKIIENRFKGLNVDKDWMKRLAEQENITPSLLEKSAKVVKLAATSKKNKPEAMLERIINNNFEIMGIADKVTCINQKQIGYSLDFINSNADLSTLIAGIKRSLEGRICIYGPSGTGKTAFAHYLAKCIGRPVIQRKASDLLDKYVGETESRIADMFRQAEDQKAVLLLDEADSFLRDREMSRQRWEVSQVNELLVQMEKFEGVFICSTNLFDDLDKSSLRRFDFKIAFDYLTFKQRWELFQQILREVSFKISKKEAKKITGQLAFLDKLTPGDYALIKRQCFLIGTDVTVSHLLEGLCLEHKAKLKGSDKVIGF